MNTWKDEYKAFRTLIKEADSMHGLNQLDKRLTRLYENGIFNELQFKTLDLFILNKQIAIGA